MKKIMTIVLAASLLFAACNNEKTNDATTGNKETSTPTESKQDRNKKVIMTSMENFAKGDFDATFKEIAPGFTDYADGSIPPITSIDSVKAFIKMLMNSVENYKGENLQYFADGDYVLVTGDWSGTFKKDLIGIKASGKTVKFRDLDMFKFNDEGKVTEHSSVQNIAAVLMASGMMK